MPRKIGTGDEREKKERKGILAGEGRDRVRSWCENMGVRQTTREREVPEEQGEKAEELLKSGW